MSCDQSDDSAKAAGIIHFRHGIRTVFLMPGK